MGSYFFTRDLHPFLWVHNPISVGTACSHPCTSFFAKNTLIFNSLLLQSKRKITQEKSFVKLTNHFFLHLFSFFCSQWLQMDNCSPGLTVWWIQFHDFFQICNYKDEEMFKENNIGNYFLKKATKIPTQCIWKASKILKGCQRSTRLGVKKPQPHPRENEKETKDVITEMTTIIKS